MEKDFLLKRYLADNERYADLLNGIGFAGKQIVTADDLQELDTQTGFWRLPFSAKARRKQPRQKYRDLIRKAAFGVNFAVIGIENQTAVDYLMALRTMSYDVGEYEKQAAVIKRHVRKTSGLGRSEFLSGFFKDSKLHPCITLVLFYGEKWDGSRDLFGMLDFTDIPAPLKKMVNNYKINLIEIRQLSDTAMFQTDLKQVFDFIRCSKDKERLRELVQKDEAYRELEEDAFDVAVSFTNAEELAANKQFFEEGGKINMCEALTALIAEGKAEGEMYKTKIFIRNLLKLGTADPDICALAECSQGLVDEVRKDLS
ncbi:MAG: transposase [Lachnospiraceae bacterium]|nr:transposase [Lachnospiraceae bacterium]